MNPGIAGAIASRAMTVCPLLGNPLSVPGPHSLPIDPEASAYLSAVEAADGRALETPVRAAVNRFVLECKSDGIWSALKESTILCGARTLAGALTPLTGSALTNQNFVSADYSRSQGMRGGSSKQFLFSGLTTTYPQNSRSYGLWITSAPPTGNAFALFSAVTGASGNLRMSAASATATGAMRARNNGLDVNTSLYPFSPGLYASTRSNSREQCHTFGSHSEWRNVSSLAPTQSGVAAFISMDQTARCAFLWMGEHVPLQTIEANISRLVQSIGNAVS